MAAPFVLVTMVLGIPIVLVGLRSFGIWNDLVPVGWGSLEGYRELVRPERLLIIGHATCRAIVVATISTCFAAPIGMFVATRDSERVRLAVLLSLAVPFLVSDAARALSWRVIFEWCGSHAVTQIGVFVALVAACFPLAVFPVVLAMGRAKKDTWIACDDLGVRPIDRALRVALPLAAPGVFIGWMSVFVVCLGAGVEPQVLERPMAKSIPGLITDLQTGGKFASAYAVGVVLIGVAVGAAVLSIGVWRRGGLRRLVRSRRESLVPLRQGLRIEWRGRKLRRRYPVSLWALTSVGVAYTLLPVAGIIWMSLLGDDLRRPEWSLDGYREVVEQNGIREAVMDTWMVAIAVGAGSAALAWSVGLCWWHAKWRRWSIGALIVIALVPGGMYALGLTGLLKEVGVQGSTAWGWWLGEIAWAIPLAVAIVFASLWCVDERLLGVGVELGVARNKVLRRVVLAQVWPCLVSAFLVGTLLAVNDYGRAVYLSGARTTISEYVYGQMESGAGLGAYAVGGSVVVVTAVMSLLALVLMVWARNSARKYS